MAAATSPLRSAKRKGTTELPVKSSDLPAGLGAITALLLTLVIHLPFWVGLSVAFLVYFGLSLLLRRPVESVPQKPPLIGEIAALEAVSPHVLFPDLRRQIDDIAAHARAILAYFDQHPDSRAQWEDYLREGIETALTGARQFASLAPHLRGPSDPAAVKFGEFLQTLSETLRGVYGQLIAADTADFTASIDAYKSTLHEINQIYLGGTKP